MAASMRGIKIILVSVFLAFASGPSEKLPLPPVPFFAMDAQDGENTYNAVINSHKIKEIAKQRGSKRIVISFFATWCIPCREGLKILSDNASELEKKGVLVFLANAGESDYIKVSNWVKKYAKEQWLIGYDKYNNFLGSDMPLPKTLITTAELQPLAFIGKEGEDFLQIILAP